MRQAEGLTDDDTYWILATLYEASVGLGDEAETERWKAESRQAARYEWMSQSTEEQVAKLRALFG